MVEEETRKSKLGPAHESRCLFHLFEWNVLCTSCEKGRPLNFRADIHLCSYKIIQVDIKLKKCNHVISCHTPEKFIAVKQVFSEPVCCRFFSKSCCFPGQPWTKMQVKLRRKMGEKNRTKGKESCVCVWGGGGEDWGRRGQKEINNSVVHVECSTQTTLAAEESRLIRSVLMSLIFLQSSPET